MPQKNFGASQANETVQSSATVSAAQLRSCFLFSQAKEDVLAVLAAASNVECLPKNHLVFEFGGEPDGLRIVQKGEVRIWLAASDGRELTLSLKNAGDVFGEIAPLDGLARMANATATRETECLFVPFDAVAQAVEADHDLAKHMLFSLCEVMRSCVEMIGSLAFANLESRLAKVIYDLAIDFARVEDNRAVFQRKFSQNDLARMLGVSREAVNKRYKAFEREGLVISQGSRLLIPDLAALFDRAKKGSRLQSRLL